MIRGSSEKDFAPTDAISRTRTIEGVRNHARVGPIETNDE